MIGRTTLYGLFGGRVRVETSNAGELDAFLRGGRGGGPEPSSWLEGEAAWELGGAAHQLAWAGRISAWGLDYSRPFDYRALGATLQPRLSTPLGPTMLTVRGDLRRGRSSLAAATPTDTAATGALALTGAAVTFGRLLGPAWVEAGGETYYGAYRGWFTGALLTSTLSRGPFDFALTARAWSTPVGSEVAVSGGAVFAATDATTLRLQLGRYATDPLYGTPGSLGASLGVSLRLGTVRLRLPRPPVVELAGATDEGRKARFRLSAPRAHTVALAGDFTDWRPWAMTRSGNDWIVEVTVPTGVHHFAFLVDGRQWLVPPDAPGVSADEWGRRNATLVVDP